MGNFGEFVDYIINLLNSEKTKEATVLGVITLPESILPKERFSSSELSKIEEAKIKHKGEQWIIKISDVDTLPSNPHAHNHASNCKMHLGTGDLYRKNKLIGTTPRKDFENFRELMRQRNIPFPPS